MKEQDQPMLEEYIDDGQNQEVIDANESAEN